ncbi:hypothetical protein ACFB49_04760 [Sphingomonas sp. DBB INV C78]|uniref:TIGR04222 domain-containing membrane protein n=1 Tax=Sphingomonas sp. DBB INV C78 TaxID=3349434 RepID=UPI0036D42737
MSLGPFDLNGGEFLALYGVLLVAAIVAGFVIPRWLRPEGRPGTIRNVDQLAILAGGPTRFVEATITRLFTTGALALIGKDAFQAIDKDKGEGAAAIAVLHLPTPLRWQDIERALKAYAQPVERALASAGLLMDKTLTLQMRFWQTSPYLLLLAFGMTKWMIGVGRDKPVGFLTFLLILTGFFALMRWWAVDRRTRAGIDLLAQAQAAAERLRRAPTADESAHAVALFGTAVLAGSSWAAFHQMRSASSGDGGGSADGSSDGGGGGCGGCGGD